MNEDQPPNGTNRPTLREVALIVVMLIAVTSTHDGTLHALLVEWLLSGLMLPR